MVMDNGTLRISAILSILTGLILFVVCVFYLFLIRNNVLDMAREEAESKSRIILDRNLATHHYFSYTLQP
jgi:hypothetical protein